MSRTQLLAFVVTALFYLAVTVGVLTTSKLVALDWKVMAWAPYQRIPSLDRFLNLYVITGQRGPAGIVAAIWLTWRSWRTRSWRPLLVLGVALILLNTSVGAVKLGVGRLGPHYAHVYGSSEVYLGGDIFPSGHTANAVVTWGVLAYLATRGRRAAWLAAGWLGFSVGLTTVYLGTHWASDVLAGWAAGALVMLALPMFEPLIASTDAWMRGLWTRWRGRRGPVGEADDGEPDAAKRPQSAGRLA